jgi:transcription termination/antitermination protein NusA
MVKIKLDMQLISYLSSFQNITRVSSKDCIDDNGKLIFIVDEILLSKAIGKEGVNVKKLEKSLNRKIKIVGFNPNLLHFVKNVIYPSKVKEIIQENDIITITAPDTITRGHLIGRNAQQLRSTESIIKRYFDIKEIKVK